MKNIALLVILGVAALSCESAVHAQIDTPRVPPRVDSSNIFERTSASSFVLIGHVEKITGVGDRLNRASKEEILAAMDKPLAGQLFQIKVDEIICRRSEFDFHSKPDPEYRQDPKFVLVFIPGREPLFTGIHHKESLLPDHKYLLFLVRASPEAQKLWVDSFDLSPSETYYRGEQLSRGVVPLGRFTEGNTEVPNAPVLQKVRTFCTALRPDDIDQKMSNLKELSRSGDPDLEQAAQSAIRKILIQP